MSPSAGRRARVHGRPGGPPAGGVAPRAPPWVFTHHKATASGFHPLSKEALPRVFTPRQASPAPVPGSGQRPRKAPSRRPHRGGFLPWPSRRPHRAVGSSLPRLSPERAPAFYAASRRLSPTHSSLSSPRYVRQTPNAKASWAHPIPWGLEGRFTSRCSTLSSLVASPSPSHLPLRRVCCPTPPLLSCPFLATLVTWGCFISLLFSRGVWRARRHRLCCCRAAARPSSRGAVNPHGGALAYCHGGQLHRAAHPQWRAPRHRRCRCRGSGRTLCRTTSSAASPLLRSTRWAAASCRSPSAG